MSLLGGFGRSARTRGWAVLDGLRSKELTERTFHLPQVPLHTALSTSPAHGLSTATKATTTLDSSLAIRPTRSSMLSYGGTAMRIMTGTTELA